MPRRPCAFYEGGQRKIPAQVLCALADFRHVSADYLPGRTDVREINR